MQAPEALSGRADAPPLVLLPGLDGTGRLFERFRAAAPRAVPCRPLAYPQISAYDELEDWARDRLPAACLLLGESFGGPLALRLAASLPGQVLGVVLVATFVVPPGPGMRLVPWGMVTRVEPSDLALRWLLLSGARDAELLAAVREVRAATPRWIVASRLRAVARVDARPALERCAAPILYLQATHDRVVRRRSLAALLSARPGVSWRRIEAPHLLLQSAPGDAWRAITDWARERSLFQV